MELAFAVELTAAAKATVEDASANNIADGLGVPKEYVYSEMILKARRLLNGKARRLLIVNYELVITVTIPAAVLADIAEENETVLDLSNPTTGGTVGNMFASSLGSMPELTDANGGVAVTVSVEVQLLNVPGSLNDVACAKYRCFGGCYHSKKKNNFFNKGTCRKGLNGRKGSPEECKKKGDLWCGK